MWSCENVIVKMEMFKAQKMRLDIAEHSIRIPLLYMIWI